MPNVSLRTFTSGARQFVVQDAFEIMLCFAGIVRVVIHAQHNRDIFTLCGRRNDHLFHRAAQMFLGVFGIRKAAGRFHYHLHAEDWPSRSPPDL